MMVRLADLPPLNPCASAGLRQLHTGHIVKPTQLQVQGPVAMSEEPCCCVKLAIAVNNVVAEGGVDVGRGEGWVAGGLPEAGQGGSGRRKGWRRKGRPNHLESHHH